jgi:hypothetical protein
LDDELRSAIDRLVRDGGRLTVHGSGGASVVLEQPGSRFGILEVAGRLTVPREADRSALDGALPSGWSDPTVTQRLGREIRLYRGEPGEGPQIGTRTWRVPPALASGIVADVRTALGEPVSVEFEPIPSRGPRSAPSSGIAQDPALSGRPAMPPIEDDPADLPRVPGRSLPAPIRAVLVLALVVVVGFVWAGMISGAPRQPGGPSGQLVGAIPTGAPPTASPTLSPTATPVPTTPPTPAPYRSHILAASSTEDDGSPTAAVDGNPMTAWRAAFGIPQWIEIALDDPSTVNEVMLLIAQAEAGTSRHMIQVAQVGGAFQVVGVVEREIADGDAIFVRLETPIDNVERIRIETLASPSNVGWYEVIVR